MISRLPTRVQIASNRKPFQSNDSLYPDFSVYLTTIGGRLSFIKPLQSNRSYQGDVQMDNNIFKERFLSFFLYVNIRTKIL